MITYLVFAMARSGHHAIINWIGKNFPGECQHWNNGVRGWDQKKFIPYSGRGKLYGEGSTKGQIINFEDFDINDFALYKMPEFEPFKKGVVIPVILVREPSNWIASSIKIGGYANKFLDRKIGHDDMGLPRHMTRVELYKRQIREALGETNILPANKVPISFDKWFETNSYKKEIAEKLSLPTWEKGIDDVPWWGSGSSFQKRSLNGQARKMRVLNRFEHYKGNKRFKRLTSDEELKSLWRKFCQL